MLKISSNIQKGSQHLKKISQAAKQAHSFFTAADTLAGHVQHNKAFGQKTRDNAKNARYVTETLKNITGGKPTRFKPVERQNLPTHIRVPSSSNPSDDEVLRTIQGNWNRNGRNL